MSESWYSITPTSGNRNGTLTITAEANTGPDRSATATVSLGNGKSKSFLISQEGLLTITFELINPVARIYATIESEELYDYFSQIKRFEVTFTNYPLITETVIVRTSHFSEDGKNCFSEYIDHEKYNLTFNIRFIAVQMLSDEKKYVQVRAEMIPI